MAKMISSEEYSEKLFYKIGEVCQLTDTQPYVLRFWESEFPQLIPQKNNSGQRIYRSSDIGLILRIKKLLYEEEFTIAGARKQLEGEQSNKVNSVDAEGSRAQDRKLLFQEIRNELESLLNLLESPSAEAPAEEGDPGRSS